MSQQTPPQSLKRAALVALGAVRDTVQTRVARGTRGMALMIAMMVIAILGTLSVQFWFHTGTNIWMSGNLAAQTKAYFNARSSFKIALLAVNAKQNFPQMKQFLSLMGKGAAERLEIWQRACDFVNIFATGKAEFFGFSLLDFSDEKAVGARSMIEGQPAFSCTVTSEDARVNLNRAATPLPIPTQPGAPPSTGPPNAAQLAQQQRSATQLYVQLGGLLRGMVESGHFGDEEEVTDLILAIIDWTDTDEQRSEIDPQSGNFIAGAGGETDYGKYGYVGKNAKMDTVGELQLVEGMTSDVYCRIRDKLTVFSTDKINVNDADLGILKGVMCEAISDETARLQLCFMPGPTGITSPMDDALITLESCRQLKKQVYSTPFTSMSKFNRFFQQFPTAMGTGVPLPVNNSIVSQQLGVRTKMVRIEAEGVFGYTKRKMVGVVDTQSGALVHFHYE